MYCDCLVDIPDVKGKIIKNEKGNSTYILFQYGQDYLKERKYVIPKRVLIGKASPDAEGKMFPNEKFQTYFQNEASKHEGLKLMQLDGEAKKILESCHKSGKTLHEVLHSSIRDVERIKPLQKLNILRYHR